LLEPRGIPSGGRHSGHSLERKKEYSNTFSPKELERKRKYFNYVLSQREKRAGEKKEIFQLRSLQKSWREKGNIPTTFSPKEIKGLERKRKYSNTFSPKELERKRKYSNTFSPKELERKRKYFNYVLSQRAGEKKEIFQHVLSKRDYTLLETPRDPFRRPRHRPLDHWREKGIF